MNKKILLALLVFLLSFNLSYSDYDKLLNLDKEKTIKELKGNIEDLDKAKSDLEEKTERNDLDSTIYSFIKTDLSAKDSAKFDSILKEYNKNRQELEKELLEASKKLEDTSLLNKELFALRKKLYEDIIEYINPAMYAQYLQYIKEQTTSYKEEIELDTDIIKKSEIVNEKITNIEEKIKEHKTYLNETLTVLINEQIDKKIEWLIEWENFKNMSLEEKLALIDKILSKVDKLQTWFIYENNVLNVAQNVKANNNKKIEICFILIDRFTELKAQIESENVLGLVSEVEKFELNKK